MHAVSDSAIAKSLLRWYDRHARDLPWRRTRDPYRIWISEIMLQQTRVAAVLEHYRRFLRHFPTMQSLARAPLSAVLAQWSGLGYYRRARMLHAAARELGRRRAHLPRTAEELRHLPGIGPYTAAAIASIAFGEKTAVVDGNVERVLRRLLACDDGDDFWAIANSLISAARPGDFNQAMMELGAVVCVPGQPDCLHCPLYRRCKTRGPHEVLAPERRRRQTLACALAIRNTSVYLVRRPIRASLMAGMWELPEIVPNGAPPLLHLKHSITVTDYSVQVFSQPSPPVGVRGKWVPLWGVLDLPLTGLCRKVLHRAGLL